MWVSKTKLQKEIDVALKNRDDDTISKLLWSKARPFITGRMDASLRDEDYHRYVAGHAYKIVRDDVMRIVSGEDFIDKIIDRIRRKQL